MKNNPYILPKEVKPVRYNLELTPNFKDLTFNGNVVIDLDIIKDTKGIKLNAQDLDIIKAELRQKENFKVVKINYNKKYQTASLLFDNLIKKGKAILMIEFKGKVNESLHGLYKS